MDADIHVLDFDQFEALRNSGLLDSLYESLAVKEKALSLYKSQHPLVRQRIRALKKIQYETLKIEVQFYKELAELENIYSKKQEKLFQKRRHIVSGDYQPSAEESDWFLSDIDKDDDPKSNSKFINAGDAHSDLKNESSKHVPIGIPGFWLTVLKNAPLTSDLVHPADQPALQHLIDIRSISLNDNGKIGFQLEFEFEPNDYFTNQVLFKRYFLTYDLKEENPLAYDGPEMLYSEGCQIHWKPNKNITLVTSSKVQKGNTGMNRQVVTRSKYVDSFFRFFDPPQSTNEIKNSVLEQKLLEDYDLGQYFKERIIPRAVTYFTGESLDVDQEVDDEEDEFPEDEFFDGVEDPDDDKE